MSAYVDDANIRAKVGRLNTTWCHLTADSESELVAFAVSLGLRAEWLQNSGRRSFHFDVTPNLKRQAIRAGAQALDYRQFGELIANREPAGST